MDFTEWMGEGDLPEVDWSDHLSRLALRGDLGRAGRKWLLDLAALRQPYACESGACTPGRRAPRTRSCCADLAVDTTDAERAAIAAALPAVAAHLRDRDPRWADGSPRWRDDGALTRPGGRCVFSVDRGDGLRCALREVEEAQGVPRGTIQPMPCRLFPLVVVDLGDGRWLLTAVHPRTARRLGHPTAKQFPCLRVAERPTTVAEQCRDTIVELFGAATWGGVERALAQPR